MRQSVTITGLGNENFKANITKITAIENLFNREFRDNSLSDWSPSTFKHMAAIDISNRIFTKTYGAPDSHPEEIHPSIDPTGRLKKLAGQEYIHTIDNKVEYYHYCLSSGRLEVHHKHKKKKLTIIPECRKPVLSDAA